jgi:hypothetical protein
MAVSITRTEIMPPQRVGNKLETHSRLAMTSTYVTGGVPITPSSHLGLAQVESVMSITPSGTSVAPLPGQWDPVNKKIMLYETAGTVDLPLKELSSGATVANSLDVVARGYG